MSKLLDKNYKKLDHFRKSGHNLTVHILIITILLFLVNWAERTNSYNSTLLAFDYRYGFISRGAVGTIYQFLNRRLGGALTSYAAVNLYTRLVTVLFLLCMVIFLSSVCRKIAAIDRSTVGLVVYFIICTVPTFSNYENFGRLDIYLIMLTFLMVGLVIADKAIWLLPLMMAGCMCIHEGYVFLYFALPMVLVLGKALDAFHTMHSDIAIDEVKQKANKAMRGYIAVLIFALLLVLGLFIYFIFFSKSGRQDVYDSIVKMANQMCYHHKCHKNVIKAEILGVDLTDAEAAYRAENHIEIIFFLLLYIPFLLTAGRVSKNLIQGATDRIMKIKYILYTAGAISILPLFVFKVDYGRWIYAVIFYYIILWISLIAMDDKYARNTITKTFNELRAEFPAFRFMLVYALLFVPFKDTSIDTITNTIYNLILTR